MIIEIDAVKFYALVDAVLLAYLVECSVTQGQERELRVGYRDALDKAHAIATEYNIGEYTGPLAQLVVPKGDLKVRIEPVATDTAGK